MTQDTEDMVALIARLRRDAFCVPSGELRDDRANAADRLQSLSDRIDVLTRALEFYADRAKYQYTGASKYYPLADDEGAVARAALHQEGIATVSGR